MPGGEFDLKTTDEWGYWYRKHYVLIDKKLYYLDAAQLGNILYGFVGSMIHSESELLEAADLVSFVKISKPDSKEDQYLIKCGIEYFTTGSFSGLEDIPYIVEEDKLIILNDN